MDGLIVLKGTTQTTTLFESIHILFVFLPFRTLSDICITFFLCELYLLASSPLLLKQLKYNHVSFSNYEVVNT